MEYRVFLVRLGRVLARTWRRIQCAIEVSAERRQLAGLDDEALKDLGISRAQAAFEASRAPWDVAAQLSVYDQPRGHALHALKAAE